MILRLMLGPLAGSKGGIFVGFKLLYDLKKVARQNDINKQEKELKSKIKNPDKSKVDERLLNLEKAVCFLLEKEGAK